MDEKPEGTKIDLPAGQTAKVTGPSTTEMQPGAKVETDPNFMAGWSVWMKFVAQAGAFGVVCVLLIVLIYNQLSIYNALMAQREHDVERFIGELKEFRTWAEAREDRARDREDKSRERQWQVLAEIKDILRRSMRLDLSGMPTSPLKE